MDVNSSPVSKNRAGPGPQTLFLTLGAFVIGALVYALLIAFEVLRPRMGAPPRLPLSPPVFWGALSSLTLAGGACLPALTSKPLERENPLLFLLQLHKQLLFRLAVFEAVPIYAVAGQMLGLSRPFGLLLCAASLCAMIALIPGLLNSVAVYRRMQSGEAEPRLSHFGGGR